MAQGKCACGTKLDTKASQCRPCARLCAQKRRDAGLTKSSTQSSREWRTKHPERHLLLKSRSSAKRRGLEHTITLEDIVIPDKCPVFGWDFVMVGDVDKAPSIDRIDSSKGYVPDNIQVMSWRANNIKGDSTLEELTQLVEYMKHG